MEHPILYHKGKGGAMFSWRVWTEGKNVKTEYGQVDGKKQVASYEAKPTNEGRTNVRDGAAQAEFEAKAMWQHKLDRKYSKTQKEAKAPLLLPMLAHDFSKTPLKAKFPCDVQPKFDGVRCMAIWEDGKAVLLSRSGKEWNVEHIAKGLIPYFKKHPDSILDGELYVHGESLQTISSYVKRKKPGTETVRYYVYDVAAPDGNDSLPWQERREHIAEVAKLADCVTAVESVACADKIEAANAHLKFVEELYEGAIIRNLDGLYMFGYRSYDLLKVKHFVTSEFTVLRVEEGVGKMKGCAVFVLQNDESEHTFKVVMKSTMAERAKQWTNREKYIGKKLTVRYQYRTEDKVPFIPTGVAFRLEKDL